MKKHIKKIMLVIMAIAVMNVSLFSTMLIANAANGYDSNKAISYAESHWNTDSSQLCAEFISNCLKAGGVSAWSTSCTALRKQLISSGLGNEYEINLQSDMTIKASDYTNVLSKGDVVFFYCPGCVNIDGKPYIHVVLCNGMDSNGYMKAYSHNGANSGRSKYQYSSKCYSCGTKISKAYVYHFNNGYDPQGSIDELTGGTGTIRVAGWAFDKDSSNPIDVKVYVGGDVNSGSPCYTVTANQTRDDVAKVYSVGSNHGFSKEISVDKTGTLDVYVYAINASGTGGKDVFLGKKTVTVTKPFGINFEANKYELSANQQKTIQFTFKGDGIYTLAYGSSNSDVCDATWGDVDWKTGKASMTVNAKSAGKSTITVILQDSNNNALYQKSFDVVVAVEKGNIRFDKNKMTLNLTDNKMDTANLTWDFKTGVRVNPDYDPEIVSVSYDNVTSNSARIKCEAIKAGSTVVKFTIVDVSGNEMGTASMTVNVEDTKTTDQQNTSSGKDSFSISFASDKYELSANQQKTIQFTFKGDGIYTLAYGSSNSDVCDATWGDVDWNTGKAGMTINAKSAGKSTVTVILQDSNNNALYQKSFDVVVAVEKGNISFDKNKMALNLTDNKTDTANLTWDFKTGVRVNPDYDPEIVSVSYDNVTSNSARIKCEAIKAGSTVVKFTIVDASGNEMGTARLTITVEGNKVSDKAAISNEDVAETQVNEEKINEITVVDKNTEDEKMENENSTEVINDEQVSQTDNEDDETIVETNVGEDNNGEVNSAEISNDEQQSRNDNQDIEDLNTEQEQQENQIDSNNQSTQTTDSGKNTNKNSDSKNVKGYLKKLYDYANKTGMTDTAKKWAKGKINQYKWW